jgi:hypothetical protein
MDINKKEIIDVKRIKDQNNRMKEWFKERTRIGGFLFEQMAKVDEILSTTIAARDGICKHTLMEDEYGLEVLLIDCSQDVLWYDRDKPFWKYCPFCGGLIKIINEDNKDIGGDNES